jgi:hypothetical protein
MINVNIFFRILVSQLVVIHKKFVLSHTRTQEMIGRVFPPRFQLMKNSRERVKKKLEHPHISIPTLAILRLLRMRYHHIFDFCAFEFEKWTVPQIKWNCFFFDLWYMLWFDVVLKTNKLEPEPLKNRESPLNENEWNTAFDSNGQIINVEEIKRRIFCGVR